MSMFERAASAWKIQSEEERTARTKQDRKLRQEFGKLLKEITAPMPSRCAGRASS